MHDSELLAGIIGAVPDDTDPAYLKYCKQYDEYVRKLEEAEGIPEAAKVSIEGENYEWDL